MNAGQTGTAERQATLGSVCQYAPFDFRASPAKPTLSLLFATAGLAQATPVTTLPHRATEVSIRDDSFLINGRPTYAGRSWKGKRIEGLLLNARLVEAIFDDLNSETVGRWAYPDIRCCGPSASTS